MILDHVCTSETCPEPGFYYVTVIYADRYWKMAGPYSTHQESLAAVGMVRKLTRERGGSKGLYMEAFGSWGTTRLSPDHIDAGKPGVLNTKGLL